MKVYLDDLRNPPNRSFTVVRSFNAAVDYISTYGCPLFISFDHDLGEKDGKVLKTGMDLAKWLVERDLNNKGFIPVNFNFIVHSANPVGKANIEGYLNAYLKHRK